MQLFNVLNHLSYELHSVHATSRLIKAIYVLTGKACCYLEALIIYRHLLKFLFVYFLDYIIAVFIFFDFWNFFRNPNSDYRSQGCTLSWYCSWYSFSSGFCILLFTLLISMRLLCWFKSSLFVNDKFDFSNPSLQFFRIQFRQSWLKSVKVPKTFIYKIKNTGIQF